MLKKLLTCPRARGLDIDDPRTTEIRRRIILEKPFLRRLYDEWFKGIRDELPAGKGPVIEVGSGAGYLEKFAPHVVKSDTIPCPDIDIVLDGGALPFADASLAALVMVDVFHHLSRPRSFLQEAQRCLSPGGMIIMIEPWVTPWSRFAYGRFHPEPFVPEAKTWEFPSTGPLSGANIALPWIVFSRDRDMFQAEFPLLRIQAIEPMMPFLYLLSGGLSFRSFQPGWTYPLWRFLERLLVSVRPDIAMFARIAVHRIETGECGPGRSTE